VIASSNRYGYIDTLRGISAILVIVSHMSERIREHYLDSVWVFEQALMWLLSEIFDTGRIGVVIFFCISGFLIPSSLSRSKFRPMLTFIITRFFRLYPVYWASIPIALVVIQLPNGRFFSHGDIIANFTMLQQFIGRPNIQGLYWTLQIELIFYFVCVLMFILGQLDKPARVLQAAVFFLVASILMSAARYLTDSKLPVALPLSLAIMFWGYLWRMYLVDKNEEAKRFSIAFGISYIILLIPICLMSYNRDYGFGETWYKYLVSYTVGLFIFCFFTNFRKINWIFGEYLGRISYSMYLFGTVSIVIELNLLKYLEIPVVLHMAIAVGLCIVISSVTFAVIEDPSIKLGKRILTLARGNSAVKVG